MSKFAIVEKKNHLAIYSVFDSKERAEKHLTNVMPDYISRGFLTNKALKEDDFEVIPYTIGVPK